MKRKTTSSSILHVTKKRKVSGHTPYNPLKRKPSRALVHRFKRMKVSHPYFGEEKAYVRKGKFLSKMRPYLHQIKHPSTRQKLIPFQHPKKYGMRMVYGNHRKGGRPAKPVSWYEKHFTR